MSEWIADPVVTCTAHKDLFIWWNLLQTSISASNYTQTVMKLIV